MEMRGQPTAEPMLSEIAEPAAKAAAWGSLLLAAIALAIATARNLLGED